jgi:hypothetical protein
MDEMTNQNPAPAPADQTGPATGEHGPSCPPRPDGDGGTRSCTHWDHDTKLWDETTN